MILINKKYLILILLIKKEKLNSNSNNFSALEDNIKKGSL